MGHNILGHSTFFSKAVIWHFINQIFRKIITPDILEREKDFPAFYPVHEYLLKDGFD